MNKVKISAVLLTTLLLIGAGGCNRDDKSAATDSASDTTSQASPTPTTDPIKNTATGVQVLINSTGFEPKNVTVKVGDNVTWTNNSGKNARVASDPHPQHTGLAGFDDLNGAVQGDVYTFTFTKAGTWAYHDHNNPSMKGTVTVTE